jgi:hypothetical protein
MRGTVLAADVAGVRRPYGEVRPEKWLATSHAVAPGVRPAGRNRMRDITLVILASAGRELILATLLLFKALT